MKLNDAEQKNEMEKVTLSAMLSRTRITNDLQNRNKETYTMKEENLDTISTGADIGSSGLAEMGRMKEDELNMWEDITGMQITIRIISLCFNYYIQHFLWDTLDTPFLGKKLLEGSHPDK